MNILFLNDGTENSEIGAQKLKTAGYNLHSVFFFTGQENINTLRQSVNDIATQYCETHNEYDMSLLVTSDDRLNLISHIVYCLVLARCKHYDYIGINTTETFEDIQEIQMKEKLASNSIVNIISTLNL